jgi:peptide chain release factor 2
MIHDELKAILKENDHAIETIKQFWLHTSYDRDYENLKQTINNETFWQNPEQGQIQKQYQHIKELRESYNSLITMHAEFNDIIALFENDEEELTKLRPIIYEHCRSLRLFKISLLLSQPNDNDNCFLTINSGAGGTESQDWSEMLLRMYMRFCEIEKLHASILDMQRGEEAGIKSATIFIRGKFPYGLLKGEHGIHRLVRVSPYDANKRRHTSFSGVFVVPEVPEVAIEIDQDDLRIDTFRAGGAGGQHVNKTDSAIRITHIPSGIVVQCQNERSQTQNKETALKMLKARLVQKAKDERKSATDAVEKRSIEWGSQIRSYVLHPYRLVKDHRTDFESPQPEVVLDGDLMGFIEQYLIWISKENKE